MAAVDEYGNRPSHAIESLDARLRALEQHLSSSKKDDRHDEQSAPERVRALARDIQSVSNNSEAASNLLDLHRKYHDSLDFQPDTSNRFGAPSESEKLAIVNSCATSFPSTVSQLTSLESLSIPSSESLVILTGLDRQVADIALAQESHARVIAELRVKTATLLQRWHNFSVLSVANCWAEWEERLLSVEAAVRQAEAASLEQNREFQTVS